MISIKYLSGTCRGLAFKRIGSFILVCFLWILFSRDSARVCSAHRDTSCIVRLSSRFDGITHLVSGLGHVSLRPMPLPLSPRITSVITISRGNIVDALASLNRYGAPSSKGVLLSLGVVGRSTSADVERNATTSAAAYRVKWKSGVPRRNITRARWKIGSIR